MQTTVSQLNVVSVQLANATVQTITSLSQSLDASFKAVAIAISSAYVNSLIPLNGFIVNFTDAHAAKYHIFISTFRAFFALIISQNGNVTASSVHAMESIVKNSSMRLVEFTASMSDMFKAASSIITDVVKQFIISMIALFAASIQIVHDSLIGISVSVKVLAGVHSEALDVLRKIIAETLQSLTTVLTNVNGVNSSESIFIPASVSGVATVTTNVNTAVEFLIGNIVESPTSSLTAAFSGILGTSVGFVAEAMQTSVNEINVLSVEITSATAQTSTTQIKNLDAAFEANIPPLSNAYKECSLPLNGQFHSYIEAGAAEYLHFINVSRCLFELVISFNGNIPVSGEAAIENIARNC